MQVCKANGAGEVNATEAAKTSELVNKINTLMENVAVVKI